MENIWFVIFISYLVLQGLFFVIGSELSNAEEIKRFSIFRVLAWIVIIVLSPLINCFVMLSVSNIVKENTLLKEITPFYKKE